MYLERAFSRTAAGGTWAQDVLPADAAGKTCAPWAPGSTVPSGAAGASDYSLSVKRRDDSGFPPLRIIVAMSGPVSATNVVVNLYVYDRRTALYYLTPDSPKTLVAGTLSYFGALTMSEPAQTTDAQAGSPLPGATDFILLPTHVVAGTNGVYTFAWGPAYGRSAP